jgi:hypothetical protein
MPISSQSISLERDWLIRVAGILFVDYNLPMPIGYWAELADLAFRWPNDAPTAAFALAGAIQRGEFRPE